MLQERCDQPRSGPGPLGQDGTPAGATGAAPPAASLPPPSRSFAPDAGGADRDAERQPGVADPRVMRAAGRAGSLGAGGGGPGLRTAGTAGTSGRGASLAAWGGAPAGGAAAAGKAGGSRSAGGVGRSGSGRPLTGAEGAPPGEAGPDMDQEFKKAKSYALTLINRNPMAAAELAKRLEARGHAPRLVAAVVAWLEGEGALGDALYAKLYARSKWDANLSAPAKIRRELTAQGVASEHTEAALAAVFGSSRRIKLTGRVSQEEKEVREALLEAARRHVEQRRGSYTASTAAAEGSSGRGGGGGDWAAAARAQAKDRAGKRRRLGMWLQYRGHDMDLIFKLFGLLGI